MYGIVKSSSYSKLKPTLFSEGVNSLSYVRIVAILNVVGAISISDGIKLRRS